MAEIPFAFVIAGEELNPGTVNDPEQKEMLDQIVEAISARVEGLKCPEHDEPPRFFCSGESFEELNVQVHGCCEQMVELVNQHMTRH